MSRIRRHLAAASLVALTACGPGIAPEDLPALPEIDVSGYLEPVARQLNEAREAVERRPVDAAANGQLGKLLRVYRDYEVSEVALRRARLLAPGDADWIYFHGEVLEQLGNYEGSLEAMRLILESEPDYGPARLRSVRLLTELGRLDEAAAALDGLQDAEPNNARAHLARARIRERRGDLEGAAESLNHALSIAGDFGQGHYALSLVYRRLGREDEAESHMFRFEQFRTIAPPADDPRLQALLRLNRSDKPVVRAAQIAKSRGDDRRALELLEAAIERNPENPETRAALIAGYASEGEFDRAEAHYRAGIEKAPGHAAILYSLGRLRLAEWRLPEAAEALSEVTSKTPRDAKAWAWLGTALERQGYAEQAGEAYERGVAADPADQTARRHYAVWLLIHVDTDTAAAELRRMAQVSSPDGPKMLGYLANVYLKAGDRAAAIESIDRGIALAERRGDAAAASRLRGRRYELQPGPGDGS